MNTASKKEKYIQGSFKSDDYLNKTKSNADKLIKQSSIGPKIFGRNQNDFFLIFKYFLKLFFEFFNLDIDKFLEKLNLFYEIVEIPFLVLALIGQVYIKVLSQLYENLFQSKKEA